MSTLWKVPPWIDLLDLSETRRGDDNVTILWLFFLFCSELDLKPQGKLTVTVVKASSLKNKEMIGKSDPYVVLHIRPIFKVKTKVIDNNLNPVWNETFELIAEDKETQALILEVSYSTSVSTVVGITILFSLYMFFSCIWEFILCII